MATAISIGKCHTQGALIDSTDKAASDRIPSNSVAVTARNSHWALLYTAVCRDSEHTRRQLTVRARAVVHRDPQPRKTTTKHVGIHHIINDARNWGQGVQSLMGKVEEGNLPTGTKPLVFIPATRQKVTVCVWEAESADAGKKSIDLETSAAAPNEYCEVDPESAMGLPGAAVGNNRPEEVDDSRNPVNAWKDESHGELNG